MMGPIKKLLANRVHHRYQPYVCKVPSCCKAQTKSQQRCNKLLNKVSCGFNRTHFYTCAGPLFYFQCTRMQQALALRSKGFQGCIANLDLGSGKTMFSLLFASQYEWNLLYMMPAKITQHIINEIERHFDPRTNKPNKKSPMISTVCPSVAVILSKSRFDDQSTKEFRNISQRSDIVVMSYEALAKLTDTQLKLLQQRCFTTCVLDELQQAKSEKCQAFLLPPDNDDDDDDDAEEPCLNAKFVMGLTAYEYVKEDPVLLELARSTSNPKLQCIVYRMPPKFQFDVWKLEMSKNARSRYTALKQQLNEARGGKQNSIVLQMRKLVSADKITAAKNATSLVPSVYKLIIVCEYQATAIDIARAIQNRPLLLLHAGVPLGDARESILETFECSEHTNTLVATRDTISVGRNLGFVDCCIMVDSPYYIKDKKQLQGRFVRIGQTPKYAKYRQFILELVVSDCCDETTYNMNNTSHFNAQQSISTNNNNPKTTTPKIEEHV